MKYCTLKYKLEKGKITYPNGDIYEGEILFGMKHGFGKLIETIGLNYIGDFMFDKKEGKGQIENVNCKCQFFGKFEKNKKQGFGRHVSCRGEVVDGEYENDKLNFGTIYYSNGDKYFGEIYGLSPHGKGELFLREKNVLEKGTWIHGKKESNSKFTRSDFYDPEEDIMNSFRNGNNDVFGY